MKTTIRWEDQGPGAVAISQGWPLFARLLGLPFAYGAGYFLFQLVDAARHPENGELTIAGWIGVTLIAAALLVPALILLAGRKRTLIDATRREAIDEFSVLVYTRRRSTMIPREAHVMLRDEEGSKSDTGTLYHTHVYLVPSAPAGRDPRTAKTADTISLAMFLTTEKPAALELAHKVSGLLGIDVRDLTVEKGEVTAGGIVVDRLDPDEAG